MRVWFCVGIGLLVLGCGKSSDDAECGPGASGTGGNGGDAGQAGAMAEGGAGLGSAGAAGEAPIECGPTDEDPTNCGECGNVCPLGACSAGECTDVPDVTLVARAAPSQIVGDGRYLYWLEQQQVLDSGSYWELVRCSFDGCPDGPENVLRAEANSRFALAGGFVSLSTELIGASGVTRRCLPFECTSEFTKLSNGSAGQNVQFISVTDTHIGYAHSQKAFVAPLNDALVGAPTLLFDSVVYSMPTALTAEHLIAVRASQELFYPASCAIAGCATAPTRLGPPTQYPPLLTSEGTDVFWLDPGTSLPATVTFTPTEFSDGGIYTCPATGCQEPTQLAAIDSWYPGTAIAVSDAAVYFTAGEPTSTQSADLVRCARTGCGSNPTKLAHIGKVGFRPSIVLDEESVYWVDYAVGSILKRKK